MLYKSSKLGILSEFVLKFEIRMSLSGFYRLSEDWFYASIFLPVHYVYVEFKVACTSSNFEGRFGQL